MLQSQDDRNYQKPLFNIKNEDDIYKIYSHKIRQQVISNKLLNKELYTLYKVRRLFLTPSFLKENIKDGTIKLLGTTYIISWLDILPNEAMKKEELEISLRTPIYRNSLTGKYPLSYCLITEVK